MRAKRAKQYRKLMHAYALSFNFREPYQVLIDAQLIQDASKFKMRLGSLLSNTLHGEIKPMITQCCIRHLYSLEAKTEQEKREKDGFIEVAKAAERRRCDHHELEEPLSTLECLSSVVDPKGGGTNRHRYVVASQDAEVRAKMRTVAGVPLIYISRSVMILEPMAGATKDIRAKEERGKVRAGLKGRRGAVDSDLKRKREEGGEDVDGVDTNIGDEQARKKKKAKGPKAPNPLSVKKSKKDSKLGANEADEERTVVKKALKKDPQAAEKAVGPAHAVQNGKADGVTETAIKRKRKRKPKGDISPEVSGNAAAELDVS